MILIRFWPKDDGGKPYYEVDVVGRYDVPTVKVREGDGYAFTELATGLTVDVRVRKSPDRGISTLDKVHEWLIGKGLEVTRDDALELLRIMNGWDGPKPEVM